MQRDADGPLACVSSGPRRRVLAQAQTRADRNGNGYGFSGSATFACRPTRFPPRALHIVTGVARNAGAHHLSRKTPGASARMSGLFRSPVQPIARAILGSISPLIGPILSTETISVFVIVRLL